MAKRIQLFDFCKSGAGKAAKSYDFSAPLTGIEPVGLNSFSCDPLLAHRTAAGQVIFSQFNQNTGAYIQALLTTPTDTGIIDHFPLPPGECLPYGANIAGLRGATPVIGSATNPFPVLQPDRTLLWSVGGAGFVSVINGVAQDLSGDATAFYRGSALAMTGFGGTNTGSSGGGTFVQLPPDNREYVGGVRLRANHHYVPFLKLPYVPSLQSLRFFYNPSHGYYVRTDAEVGFGTGPVAAAAAPVTPCLLLQNGDFGVADAADPSGPSLTRQYNFFRLTPFIVPPYNGSISATFDLSRTNCRAFMVVYVDSSQISNVTCSAGAGGSSAVTHPTITSGPPLFTPLSINYDTVYQFAITGSEASYTFDVTHGVTTTTTNPLMAGSFSGGAHVRAYEAFMSIP